MSDESTTIDGQDPTPPLNSAQHHEKVRRRAPMHYRKHIKNAITHTHARRDPPRDIGTRTNQRGQRSRGAVLSPLPPPVK